MAKTTLKVDETYLRKLAVPYKLGTVKKIGKNNYYFASGRSRRLLPDGYMPKSILTTLVGKNVALVGPDKYPIGLYLYVEDAEIHWIPRIICYIPVPDIIKRIDRITQLAIAKYQFESGVIDKAQFEAINRQQVH